MNTVRVRFAPSPTGHLHVGGARTALFNWLFARHHGGRFILRIEDTDLERSREEATEGILDSLRWLGLDWDEGPDVGGEVGPYVQSQRLELYRRYARQLLESGRAYPCFCTPEEVAARREALKAAGEAPRYDRRCFHLSPREREERMASGQPYAIRFLAQLDGELVVDDLIRGQVRFDRRVVDDFVLIKSDGYPAYNFAVVVDDYTMGITHVIRGEEHLSNTPRQIQVYEALGWPLPRFAHLPIILGPDRSKLSKRHGATWVGQFREEGYLPEALVNYLALLGWAYDDRHEIFSIDELVEKFTLEKVSKNPAIFDRQKLDWMNGLYIRRISLERLTQLAHERLAKAGILPSSLDDSQWERLKTVVELLQVRVQSLADFIPMAGYFFQDDVVYDQKAAQKFLTPAYVPGLFARVKEILQGRSDEELSEEHLGDDFRRLQESLGLKMKDVMQPIRVAVTGNSFSPGLYDVLRLVGVQRTLTRLDRALQEREKLLSEG